jgi:hypothetical protein
VYVGLAGCAGAGGGEGRNHPTMARATATNAIMSAAKVGQREGIGGAVDHGGAAAAGPGR